MKRIIAVVLALLSVMTLICGCQSNIINKDYTVERFTDNSKTQQTWLRDPETDLVINPAEYQGGTSSKANRAGLNVGVIENTEGAEKATVKRSFDDVLFLMESAAANAKVGEDYFVANWDLNDPECNLKYNAANIVADTSVPGRTAVDGLTVNEETVQLASNIAFRWDADMLLIFDMQSVSTDAQFGLEISFVVGTARSSATLINAGTSDTGKYVFNLSEYALAHVADADEKPATKINLIFRFGAKEESELLPRLVIGDFKILSVPRTLSYSSSNASYTWTPFGIQSEISFPNGSAAKTTDYFAVDATDKENVFKNVVAREIKFSGDGILFLGGKVEGKVTYDDTKTWIMVEGDEYNYVIAPKKKQDLAFFASEEDMLARRNGTDTPTANTKYWTLSFGTYAIDDSVYVAIAFGTKNDTLESLGEKAKAVVSSSKAIKYYNRAVAFWDWYLKRNEIPNTFIDYDEPVA